MSVPGSTVARVYVGNRFCIREVASRFRKQTVFFLHDLSQPSDSFDGPFYSEKQARDRIKEIR